MSVSSAFDSEPIEALPWTADLPPVVMQYSSASHYRFTRPLKDWVALVLAASVVAVFLYALIFAMAMFPIP